MQISARSKARAFPRNFRGAGRPGRGEGAHFLVYVPPSKRAKASERQAMAGVCRNHRIRIQSRRVGRRPRIARGLIGARRLCRRPCGFRHRPGPPQPWDERRRCAGSRREEADDAELLAEALANEPVMLTNDRDFLVLASRRTRKVRTYLLLAATGAFDWRNGAQILREASSEDYRSACSRVHFL